MALETLKGVKEIGGFDLGRDMSDEDKHVFTVDQWISFRIQNGPVNGLKPGTTCETNGVNGCQVDTLIHAAQLILEGLNEKFPSKFNREAIWHLDEAIECLEARTKDREKRNVEGTSQA